MFPPIRDRDPESPAAPRKLQKAGEGWTIAVDGVHAQGIHELWVYQVRGALEGDVRGNLSFQTRGGPLSVDGGEADLAADIHLEPKSAGGFVKLTTDSLRARPDEQEVAGRLTLDIELQGGVPAEMDFDISGSSLRLDGFEVAGARKTFDAYAPGRAPVRLKGPQAAPEREVAGSRGGKKADPGVGEAGKAPPGADRNPFGSFSTE